MDNELTTIKVRESTRSNLRKIAAETDETLIEAAERLALAELEKINRSKGMPFQWDVFEMATVGAHTFYGRLATVVSDSAGHACDYVTATQRQSRLSLVGFPQGEKPMKFTTMKTN